MSPLRRTGVDHGRECRHFGELVSIASRGPVDPAGRRVHGPAELAEVGEGCVPAGWCGPAVVRVAVMAAAPLTLMIDTGSGRWWYRRRSDATTSPTWCRSWIGMPPLPRPGVDHEAGCRHLAELVLIASRGPGGPAGRRSCRRWGRAAPWRLVESGWCPRSGDGRRALSNLVIDTRSGRWLYPRRSDATTSPSWC